MDQFGVAPNHKILFFLVQSFEPIFGQQSASAKVQIDNMNYFADKKE